MGIERAVQTNASPAWAAAPAARTPWWQPWREKRLSSPATGMVRASKPAIPVKNALPTSRPQPWAHEGDQEAFLTRLRQAGL